MIDTKYGRLMSQIEYERVKERERQLAIEERARTCDFSEVRNCLHIAVMKLNALPRPWMNDCIHESIDAINKVIAALEGE